MVTFATYVLLGNTLTASKAFVALALFNILRFPLTALPWMLMNIIQVKQQSGISFQPAAVNGSRLLVFLGRFSVFS